MNIKIIDENAGHPTKTCNVCKGSGVQRVSVTDYGSDEPPSVSEHACFFCDGAGEISFINFVMQVIGEASWCRCGNPSGESVFFKDGEGAWMNKHHYCCLDCGHVTQVG